MQNLSGGTRFKCYPGPFSSVSYIDEAAKYLNISKGHMYRLTSNRDISYTKPNGKNIFFERKELDEWKRRNPVLSQRELERQAAIMTAHDHTGKPNHKKKGGKP